MAGWDNGLPRCNWMPELGGRRRHSTLDVHSACRTRGVNTDLARFERNSPSLSLGSSEIDPVEYFGVTPFVPLTRIYSARPPPVRPAVVSVVQGLADRDGLQNGSYVGKSCQIRGSGQKFMVMCGAAVWDLGEESPAKREAETQGFGGSQVAS